VTQRIANGDSFQSRRYVVVGVTSACDESFFFTHYYWRWCVRSFVRYSPSVGGNLRSEFFTNVFIIYRQIFQSILLLFSSRSEAKFPTSVSYCVCAGRYLRVLGSLWLWRWVRENEFISSDIYLIRTSCLKLHCDLLIDSLNLRPH
jgi:hypothetical protein